MPRPAPWCDPGEPGPYPSTPALAITRSIAPKLRSVADVGRRSSVVPDDYGNVMRVPFPTMLAFRLRDELQDS